MDRGLRRSRGHALSEIGKVVPQREKQQKRNMLINISEKKKRTLRMIMRSENVCVLVCVALTPPSSTLQKSCAPGSVFLLLSYLPSVNSPFFLSRSLSVSFNPFFLSALKSLLFILFTCIILSAAALHSLSFSVCKMLSVKVNRTAKIDLTSVLLVQVCFSVVIFETIP